MMKINPDDNSNCSKKDQITFCKTEFIQERTRKRKLKSDHYKKQNRIIVINSIIEYQVYPRVNYLSSKPKRETLTKYTKSGFLNYADILKTDLRINGIKKTCANHNLRYEN